jgi:hypothetical protein
MTNKSPYIPYPQYKPRKDEAFTDFLVLYPNPSHNQRPNSPLYIADIMCWNGDKFCYYNSNHRPVYWARLPKFPEE